jgi:hypothetical protein
MRMRDGRLGSELRIVNRLCRDLRMRDGPGL